MNQDQTQGSIPLTKRMSDLILFQSIPPFLNDESPAVSPFDQGLIDQSTVDWLNILDRLKQNNYSTIETRQKDISGSWTPILEFATPGSLLHCFALKRKVWFTKRKLKIPHSKENDSALKLALTTRRVKKFVTLSPSLLMFDRMTTSGN
jgi:hypothetical protein